MKKDSTKDALFNLVISEIISLTCYRNKSSEPLLYHPITLVVLKVILINFEFNEVVKYNRKADLIGSRNCSLNCSWLMFFQFI